jgi:trans-aconitate methyltransferase
VPAPGYDPSFFRTLAELEAGSWWFRSRNRLIEHVVRKHHPGARRVLEIGTGTGYTLAALAAALPRAELVASELYEEGLEIARERVPRAEFVQLDALAMPYESEFDLVVAFDVLEHIEDDVGVHQDGHHSPRVSAMISSVLILTVATPRSLAKRLGRPAGAVFFINR